MEKNSEKKILIIGNGATEYSLAQKFSRLEKISKIFVASGNSAMAEFCETIDIREDNTKDLLDFVLENDIDLTICCSEKAIKEDIATLFHSNGQLIFGPTAQSANICLSKSFSKKFMYKNRIPCAKFGIFDKLNMAVDYLQKSTMPVVIKTDLHQGANGIFISPSFNMAKTCAENLFDSGEQKIIIEDFMSGHEFSFYVITDGYKALPLSSVATYKYEQSGNLGGITNGMGAFAPDYKVSQMIENRIMSQIVYPTINSLAHSHNPYVGILGIDCVLTGDERVYVLEFNSFLQSPDAQCILNLLEDDLYQIMQACAIGSFADDYEKINLADKYSVSCVLSSGRVADSAIEGLDQIDENCEVAHFNTHKNAYLEYETRGGRTLALSTTAKTLARATNALYEEIPLINFSGMRYRKDIGKN